MIQKVNLPVSVKTVFDHRRRETRLTAVFFEGVEQAITRLGYHHTYRDGRTLHHVFSVAGLAIFFRLDFNAENLIWLLTEVSDGETD